MTTDSSGPPARPPFEFRRPSAVPRPTRPRTVTISWVLWMVAAAVLLLAVAAPLVDLGGFRAELIVLLERDHPEVTPADRDRVATAATAVLLGGGLLLALLVAGAATAMRSGRAGARIALVVLLAPVVLHAVLFLGLDLPITLAGLGAALGLDLAAAAVMFTPAATGWFRVAHHR